MNKQQLYTFGGALLASTALSGAAHAITIGKVTSSLAFSTTSFSIANTTFSTTASTANTVVITPNATRVAARFSNIYSADTISGTQFSVEFTPTGAEFTTGTPTLANAEFILGPSVGTFTGTVGAAGICNGVIGFGTTFVIDGCTAAATVTAGGTVSANIVGVLFSGVTFTRASGLATAGGTVSLTGRVYNTATSGTFESAATGTIITSAAPVTVTVTPSTSVIASATTTPTAFTALSTTNGGHTDLTMELVTIVSTATGALQEDLTTLATGATEVSTARLTVTSTVLSSGAVSTVALSSSVGAADTTISTVANFSGGSVTFALAAADFAGSLVVTVVFNGTTVIPEAAAGTVGIAIGGITDAQALAAVSASPGTAAVSQGGFRGEVNTFNASTNGPFSSYLRIHNNGAVAGAVTITVRNDSHDSGEVLGAAFTTASIMPGSTMQLSAAEMEGTETSTKLPSGGAGVPSASRTGSYSLFVTGPIVGYVQHILFDGETVADLSSFRNGGVTTNNAAP